ncbi:hypothetical protein NE237_003690 [Protea cynaroides]|uniref:Uncharacterized protein n=1 Tax=Protea cynaroides TaxID=273540 RepID=A0A9Q0KHU8_9MAGN|nr:hypothetical protein NE237_003690 [Protea cynaroides]
MPLRRKRNSNKQIKHIGENSFLLNAITYYSKETIDKRAKKTFTEPELLGEALEECNNDLDYAIKSLNELPLGSIDRELEFKLMEKKLEASVGYCFVLFNKKDN